MPVCTKMISSWVRKVLSIAEIHMSLGIPWDTMASVAVELDVYLVSIQQIGDWARVSASARHCFSTYSIPCISTRN